MEKLIPMVDFVLEAHEACVSSTFDNYRYAKFLKQPINIGMFIPCDEDGNVLEEPDSVGVGNQFYYERALDQYQQAKERVLFEGFEIDEFNMLHHKETGIRYDLATVYTIEDIIHSEPTLTASAQKQIGL